MDLAEFGAETSDVDGTLREKSLLAKGEDHGEQFLGLP